MIKLSSVGVCLSVCKEFLPILNSSIIVNIILCAIWQQGDRRHDDFDGRHNDGKGQQGNRRHDNGAR